MPCTQQNFYDQANNYFLSDTANMPTASSPGSYITSQGTTLLKVYLEVTTVNHGHPNMISFNNFLANVWSTYSNHNNPCNFLLNRYNHFNNQLTNNTYSTTQTLLKAAKRNYFAHMYNYCGCGTI